MYGRNLLQSLPYFITAGAAAVFLINAAVADELELEEHGLESHEKHYVQGYPASPSEAWVLAIGGRLYDNWINTLEADGPGTTHPAWPASNTKKKNNTTWRCKSCHGWDFRGKDGKYGSGSYKTGIGGVRDVAGMNPEKIHAILMDDTHKYTHDMIPLPYMQWLTTFLSKGQYDITKYVSDSGDVSGETERGKAVFQNVCASCHGYNGTALDWGKDDEHKYVGTEANANPWEVLFKIRHGHPGTEMISLSAFGIEEAANVLAFIKTLPQK